MAYTPPAGNAVNIELGSGYTPPAGNAVHITMPADTDQVTVAAYLEQTYTLSVIVANYLEQNYGDIIRNWLEQSYWLTLPVNRILEQPYGDIIRAILEQYYGNAPYVIKQLHQYYGDAGQLRQILEQPYNDAYQLAVTLEQPYALPEFLVKTLEQRYAIAGVELTSVLEQLYDISGFDQVVARLEQPFSLLSGESQTLAYTTHVVVDGTNGEIDLSFYHINIEATLDQFCMSCEVHLASQADYLRCRILDDLTITIDGDAFTFFVESKHRQRSHGTAEYSIRGLSRTALLDAPYIEPITDELSGLASVIVANLAAGYTVDWDTVDWSIPVDTLMVADQTPLDIIRDVAKAVGALVQTEPDGTLTVEPDYPVAVPGWNTVAVDHTLSDAFDFFTTGEDYDHRPGYNRYLISDQLTSAKSLRLEEEDITSSTKYIRAYQTPWMDDFSLRHTGGDWVTIEPLGIEERIIEDEIVEFVGGAGSVSFPIYERIAMEWLQANLGTVTFGEDGSLVSSVAAESLLKISYRTKCRKYLATDHENEKVQMVAEDGE